MPVINRLKNVVGEEKDYYIPKTAQVLSKTPSFSFPDEKIPDDLKENGVKLMFYPNVYTIKRDKKNNRIVLHDISEHSVELPQVLAYFRPLKTLPEIVYNGYMLCIDKSIVDTLSPQEQKQVFEMVKHFKDFNKKNPLDICTHELTHLRNALVFEKLHQNGQRLSDKLFRDNAYLDEISATSSEHLPHATNKEDALKIVAKTCQEWLENPKNEAYTKSGGFFDGLLIEYNRNYEGKPDLLAAEMYQKLLKAYFTFKINGVDTDLSSALDARFVLKNQNVSSPKPYMKDQRSL